MSHVVVAAADSTVGAACVAYFLAEGNTVTALVSSGQHPGPDRRIVEERVAASGGAAELYAVDLADVDELQTIARDLGPIRALVTAHFALHVASVCGTPMAVWSEVTRTNFLGPVASTQAFVPNLELGRPSSIIHVGSIDGILGNPLVPSYSATKGALVPLTHVSASELGPRGIRVNCVARAGIVGSAVGGPTEDSVTAATALGRRAEPSELAAVVGFLASPAASYLTGVVIPVDGGRSGITQGTVVP